MKTQDRIVRSIANRESPVILRAELGRMGSPSQVSRSLSILVRDGHLMRAGKGIFVKTKISSITGNRIAAAPLETVATEALKKLGIDVTRGQLAAEYNNGSSTQIPTKLVVNTGKRRITRRIEVGGRALIYENTFKRTSTKSS